MQHPLFAITPPQITVCLSFSQVRAVEAECQNYSIVAQSNCGNPFVIGDLLKLRQEKRLGLAKVIAERAKLNMEEWQAEQEKKSAARQEKCEKNRLELMKQIEEIRVQKLKKRHEEIEADREYLRQSEMAELELVQRENEQRKKNIEYYNELAQIVDAQQKRTDTEIETLKSKLSRKDTVEGEADDETLVNINLETSVSDESDTDSVYFDADKSLTSSTSFLSPEVIQTPEAIQSPVLPRSTSDVMNSNFADTLAVDRARNRANVLNSNINLAASTENTQKVKIPSGPLTEAQKNKFKMLQQEFDLIDTNANAEPTIMQSASVELSELQKNRNKILASEFGITEVVVNVPTENQGNTDFNRNRKLAQGHTHAFKQLDEVNANKPKTDLQINRQKVLIQEYGMNTDSQSTNEAATIRNKLKASLSLDLDNTKQKSNLLSPKGCQSDFIVSPMSTTSDELMACSMSESNIDKLMAKKSDDKDELKLDCSMNKQVNFEQFTAEIDRPTPLSALNTAGIEMLNDKFNFNVPYKSQPIFSQILRPSSTSNSIFDISSRLSAAQNNKATPPSPVHQSSKSLSKSELQDLSAGNLAHFLEQSFTIPLQVYSNILNNEILKIFFQDFGILNHFHSLRNYFFMMDGEFGSNICDGILGKLQTVRKPHDLLNSYNLNGILENALQSSLVATDKNADNLSFSVPNVPEKFDLSSPNVLSDLHLSYKVEWPLNLLLSAEAIEHYNKVFQHLLKLRRITWQLDECLNVSSSYFQ